MGDLRFFVRFGDRVWRCKDAESAAASLLRAARKADATEFGIILAGESAQNCDTIAEVRMHPDTGPYICVGYGINLL